VDFQQRALLRLKILVAERQGPHKRIEHGEVQFAVHDPGLIHGETDLLLVMPALRVFPRQIEPVRRAFFPRPDHRQRGFGVRIELPVQFAHFPTGVLQQVY
jgi:hypothetical protein